MNVNIPYLTTNFFPILVHSAECSDPTGFFTFWKGNQLLSYSPCVHISFSILPSNYLFFLILQRNDSVLFTESYLSYRMTGKNIKNLYVNPFSIESQKLYQASNHLTDTDVSRPIRVSGWKANSSHFWTWDHSEYIKHI